MESLFKGYYQPNPAQFKELWEEGTFVFDTNVLLGLYRYKVESRDEILNVIRQIEDRIWIPYQVGLEFHKNRLTVLGEQNSSLSTIKNSIRDSISSIEKKCKDLDLDKRHSEIETSTFIERFRELSESVINELNQIKAKKLSNDIDEDVILTELTKLFSIKKGSLGLPPKDQKVLEDIYKDGEFRAKNKIPPSFEDILEAQKNKSGEDYYSFEGLNYKKGFGDLIVWKQIIEFARENQKKNIIFVTDDTKVDWMRIINLNGKKTIGARPELVSEIFKEAGVENFYIYHTKSFLDYSKEYLKTDIQDETIEDVKNNYLSFLFEKDKSSFVINDEMKVKIWLDRVYSLVKETESQGRNIRYDYLALQGLGGLIPVYVKFTNNFTYEVLDSALSDIRLSSTSERSFRKHHIVLIDKEISVTLPDKVLMNINERFMNSASIVNDFIDREKELDNPNLIILVTLGYTSKDSNKFEKVFEYQLGTSE
ncbi:PIN-like domain-containing protein [Psychrobacter aquimaris]|uniref:PIN-like domain-containing protein n=1 Tax=Psychrobacter aquimaris TaxID=292733 RepID=UPI0018DF9CBC|nr:PIN-like domain-containing protein [Psychrobacter aquimaris]